MKKEKTYKDSVFAPEVITAAIKEINGLSGRSAAKITHMHINLGGERWDYNSESEFYDDYREAFEYASFTAKTSNLTFQLECYGVRCSSVYTNVAITHDKRDVIQRVFQVFESKLPEAAVSAADKEIPRNPPHVARPPTVFIGHGRSTQWKDLKDHLHELHGYPVQAYETGARAGHTIRDVLDHVLQTSSFAIIVHTAEDLLADGKLQARPNVIHETGLFQGKLGFVRVAILLEDGAEDYSNLHGINQIRYSSGNIRETFGDVLAILRREFGPNPVDG